MKVIEQVKGSTTLTVGLEWSDFPTRRMLKMYGFNTSLLPREYLGESIDVNLTMIFVNSQPKTIKTRNRYNGMMDHLFDKTLVVEKATASTTGWRLAAIAKRFDLAVGRLNNYEYYIGQNFLNKTKTKKDYQIIESYFYLITRFWKDDTRQVDHFIFDSIVREYKKEYKEFPSSRFLAKVISETDINSFNWGSNKSGNNLDAVFSLYDEKANNIVKLSSFYSTEQLKHLILKNKMTIESVVALNALGITKVDDILKEKENIPEEWLIALAN